MGGGDLHFENILVANGNAFVCDCETVLGVHPTGSDRLPGAFIDSVFKTTMLEWPRAVPEQDLRISGYAGGESYQIPYAVPKLNERRMSLEVAVEHKAGIRVEAGATNRVYLDGRLVQPEEYKDAIVEGFNRVYDWFRDRPDEAIALLRQLFVGTLVRFINWGTQTYSQLMIATRHPKRLAEPLEIDLIFNALQGHRRKWDEGALAQVELESLWKLDVPIFTADASSLELVYNYQKRLPVPLAISALDNAGERLQKLSVENRTTGRIGIFAPAFPAAEIGSARLRGLGGRLRPARSSANACAQCSSPLPPPPRGKLTNSRLSVFTKSMYARTYMTARPGSVCFWLTSTPFALNQSFVRQRYEAWTTPSSAPIPQ